MEHAAENEKRTLRDRRTLKTTDFYSPQIKRPTSKKLHRNTLVRNVNVIKEKIKGIKVEYIEKSDQFLVENDDDAEKSPIINDKLIEDDDDFKLKDYTDLKWNPLGENYNPIVLLTKCDDAPAVKICKNVSEDIKKCVVNNLEVASVETVTFDGGSSSIKNSSSSSSSIEDDFCSNSSPPPSTVAFYSTPKLPYQPNSSITIAAVNDGTVVDQVFCAPPSSFVYRHPHQIYIRKNLYRSAPRHPGKQQKIIPTLKRNYNNCRSFYSQQMTPSSFYSQQAPSSYPQQAPSSYYLQQTPLSYYSQQMPSSFYSKYTPTQFYPKQTPPSTHFSFKAAPREYVTSVGAPYSGETHRRTVPYVRYHQQRVLVGGCDNGDENRRLPPLTCPVCWEIYFEADDFESHYRLMHNGVYLQEFGRVPCLAGPFRPTKLDAEDDSYVPQTDVACKCCFQKNINCSGTYTLFH